MRFTLFLIGCAALMSICYPKGHACKWDLCPYKGITVAEWKEAVNKYSGCDEGSDGYIIDLLHLEFPQDEYDELEEKLFRN